LENGHTLPETFQIRWNEMLNSNQGDKLKKILAIDGKTQRGNGSAAQKPNHIVRTHPQ